MAIKLLGSWWRNFFGKACTFYSPITTSLFIRVTQRSAYLSLSLSLVDQNKAKGTIVIIESTIVIDWRKKSHAKKGIPKQYDDKHTANRRHVIIFYVVFFFIIVNNYY